MVKILKKILDVILITIIIALSLYFILRFSNRIRIYNVMTGSMEDNIHAGDYILILKKDNYRVGDIVTFSKEGYYITHRIIKMEGNKVTTKGDANNVEDATINESSIIGKVILIGGILNIVINYKFAIVGILLSIYLLTCYFDKGSENGDKKATEIKNADEKNMNEIEEKEETGELDNQQLIENEEVPIVAKTKRKKKEKIVEETDEKKEPQELDNHKTEAQESTIAKQKRKKKEKIVEEIFDVEEKNIKRKK